MTDEVPPTHTPKRKKTKAKKPTKKSAAKRASSAEVIKFGVPQLAKKLDLTEETTRIKLRDAKIKKSGRSYDFGSAAGLDKIAKKLAA